jgi:ribosomal protein L7Ae-like RNA K-turn-binding protein
VLGLIGLGVRGRLAVVGVERVREAAMKHKLVMAFVAPDASRHSLDKIVPLLDARRVRYVRGPGAAMLGRAVGRDTTAAVGIVDRQLAKGIRALLVDMRRVE